jgi:hypothetical protein
MATGDSKLTICNDALIMLGGRVISSFSEGTDNAQVADRLYDDIKVMCLTMYPWSFSFKKVQLARTLNTPVTEWKYEYQIPGDVISGPRALFDTSSPGARPVTWWERYEDKVLTSYERVWIDYQFDPGEDRLPSYFVQLLKYMLAWHFAEPVTDQFPKGEYWRSVAVGTPQENGRGGYFRQAMNIDGQTQPNQMIEDFSLIAVRN